MSGGTFEYEQYYIQTLIEEMQEQSEWVKDNYSIDIYTNHITTINKLKHVYIHVQRLDWLFAGDDDEESYKKRLNTELKMLRIKMPDDTRPHKDGWAPGNYTNNCHTCFEEFVGDKRAVTCAPCAYGDNT